MSKIQNSGPLKTEYIENASLSQTVTWRLLKISSTARQLSKMHSMGRWLREESPIRKSNNFCLGKDISCQSAWKFAWWYISVPFGAVHPRNPQNLKFWPSKSEYLKNGKLQCYRPMTYILESPHRADFKFWMTCNTATYRFWDIHFLEGQNFRFWGSLGCTAPKGTDMYHHANFHADWHEMSIPKQKVITFPYRGLLSGPPSHAMHFRKLPCCWTDFKQSSCNSLTKGSVFDVFSF